MTFVRSWETETPVGKTKHTFEDLLKRYGATEAIATSTGQNDTGLFELNFRDERYLPFEYAGAVSRWRIELPIASPSVLAGIKTSAVINVGTATLGALIGAGGYGQPILTGIRLDDTPLILKAQESGRQIQAAIEQAIDNGEVSIDDVFDRDYKIVEGSNPVQYEVRFNEAADRLVRPILDRTKASDNRVIGSAMGDMNGYLPTHLTERSHPQGPDPVWNDEHCRNKRILIDDTTRMALASEKPATLATYRMELGDKFIPVKNVFVPLWIKGRRWGNFELAYRDD